MAAMSSLCAASSPLDAHRDALDKRFGGPIPVRAVEIHCFAAPLLSPVRASFGSLTERSLLLVSLEDDAGRRGWGEVWSSYPALGARHRAAFLAELVAPALAGQTIGGCADLAARVAIASLTAWRMARDSGAISQIQAGLECALWDLAARRQDMPLYRLLGGTPRPLTVYASGVRPGIEPRETDALRARGFRAFKLKSGFEDDITLPQITAFARRMESGERLMIDSNCGWSLPQACAAVARLQGLPLDWVEEPLGPERPPAEWRELAQASSFALAGGENLYDDTEFEAAFDWLGVVQPDMGKWGGVSGAWAVARRAAELGRRYCPHAFGSTVGRALAAHMLLATGADTPLEVDADDSVLRQVSSRPFMTLRDGMAEVSDEPGIGVDPEPDRWAAHVVAHHYIRG